MAPDLRWNEPFHCATCKAPSGGWHDADASGVRWAVTFTEARKRAGRDLTPTDRAVCDRCKTIAK